jgi:hypothetical protein
MKELSENYLGFCEFSEIVPFTEDMEIGRGHYWVESHVVDQLGGFIIENDHYDHLFIRKVVENNYLPKSKITHSRKASFNIDQAPYNQFVKDMEELFQKLIRDLN